jgi:hypothetical protein
VTTQIGADGKRYPIENIRAVNEGRAPAAPAEAAVPKKAAAKKAAAKKAAVKRSADKPVKKAEATRRSTK